MLEHILITLLSMKTIFATTDKNQGILFKIGAAE